MAKQDVIEVEAIIVEALPNAMFKARLLENDVVILAHVSGKIRMNYIRILPQRGRAFDNNVGWRIDYQFATPELAETARGFVIDKAPTYDLRWSDHAPLSITYDV